MNNFQSPVPVSNVPVSKVELFVQCQNLLDKDLTSKSDPCVAVFMKNTKSNHWSEIGRTETIQNCLDPKFAKSFTLDYYFEEVQHLKFAVYDIDNVSHTLDDDDFLGEFVCTLANVVAQCPYTGKLLLKGNKPAGNSTITIIAEEIAGMNDVLSLDFYAKKLDDLDFFSKSDPFLEFSRKAVNGQWQVVHRTEVIKNNLNPIWKTVVIQSRKLCGGNVESDIKVDCYDYEDNGSHDFIGSFQTSVTQLVTGASIELSWPCVNPIKKAKKKKYKDSGTIHLKSCKVSKEYSFLDYIFGGLQLHFTVGIDFTASNGDPRMPTSLHYLQNFHGNSYVQAIQSVGTVIQDYDSDKMFPALGFGARIPPNFEVSHEFAINFQSQNPFCAGIQGITDAYMSCLSQIQLYGPTNFSPMILHMAKFASNAHQENKPNNYFVLLIITDGVITDMQQTIESIIYASSLPMSIIIVGVGDADFEAMDILDSDDGLLKSYSGKRAERDIVQFVPFNKFKNSQVDLAREVLAEIPTQVSEYFRKRNIPPSTHSFPIH